MGKKEALELDDSRATWIVPALSLGFPVCEMGWWEVPIRTASPQTSQLLFHLSHSHDGNKRGEAVPASLSVLPTPIPRFYTVFLKYQPNEYI